VSAQRGESAPALPSAAGGATHFAMEAAIIVLLAAAVIARLAWVRLQARRRARRVYHDALRRALEDGILTDEEAAGLEQLRAERSLTAAEVRMAAVALYRQTLQEAAADNRLTPEESEQLDRLQRELGLTEHDIRTDLNQLRRMRMLAAVADGQLPAVESPIDLVAGEQCHWVVAATLAQVLGLRARETDRFRAVVHPVLGAQSFHAVGERAALRPSDRILPFDLGPLIVTSRRTVFQGARRTVSVPHARVVNVLLLSDAIGIEETGGGIRYILVDDPELTAAILLHAARRRRLEIRPVHADSSA
jgi:hypothetical protein